MFAEAAKVRFEQGTYCFFFIELNVLRTTLLINLY